MLTIVFGACASAEKCLVFWGKTSAFAELFLAAARLSPHVPASVDVLLREHAPGGALEAPPTRHSQVSQIRMFDGV